jgi:hypothetical protein
MDDAYRIAPWKLESLSLFLEDLDHLHIDLFVAAILVFRSLLARALNSPYKKISNQSPGDLEQKRDPVRYGIQLSLNKSP